MKKRQIALAALTAAMLPGCRPGGGCTEIDADRSFAESEPADSVRQTGNPSRNGGHLLGVWEMENTPEGIDADLIFLSGGGLAGSTGANNFFGTFSTADGLLTMKVEGMTRAAGNPQAMDFERNFLEILALTNGFAADEDELLLLNDGARLAAFERKLPE